MVISYCIPCCNRTYDLKKVMPSVIAAANMSPPVEIVILNYNSSDDLDKYVDTLQNNKLVEGNKIVYIKYNKGKHYRMAHARNIVSLAATGEYIVETCTDIFLGNYFFAVIREKIVDTNCKWIMTSSHRRPGLIVIEKKEFIKAGGYDERFDFYGPEDQELNNRLVRRGLTPEIISRKHSYVLYTNDVDKIKNYSIKTTKMGMFKKMMPIYEENMKNKILIANKNLKWGQK